MHSAPSEMIEVLRKQIGTRGKYHNQDYELIEVLENDSAVVLRDCNSKHTIQNDMHGEAHRIVSETHTVPILSEVAQTVHPVLIEFLPGQIVNQLNNLVD